MQRLDPTYKSLKESLNLPDLTPQQKQVFLFLILSFFFFFFPLSKSKSNFFLKKKL